MDDKRDEQERDENLETFGENGVLGRSISSAELREQEKRRKEQETVSYTHLTLPTTSRV